MTVAKIIKEARHREGKTQVETAEKADISRSYLAMIEKGKYNPSVNVLLRLAFVLHIDLKILNEMSEIQGSD